MAETVDFRPQPGRQEAFLSSPADIAIYGGAAGGGKTWALLLEPVRHISNAGFGAVIFRRTIPEIVHEGALWDESKKVYPLLGAISNENDKQFRFPSGAKITFAHMQQEKDKESWKSAQVPLIEFDQLETFTAPQFFYMFSRNRSLCGVKPYIRATANPEPGWLADFLSWWIGEDGYANLDRAGVLRWFIREGDEIRWADTPGELSGGSAIPKSVTFIPSTVYDNKILMAKDPGYLANLMALSYIDRERLLGDPRRGGNWRVKPAAGKIFNRAWFEIVEAAPAGGVECRRWDFAATKPKPGKDPDYTAGVKIRKVNGVYYVLDCLTFRVDPAEVDKYFRNTSFQDADGVKRAGGRYMARWEIEPGSASKRENVRLVTMLNGLDAAGRPSTTAKEVRWKPLAAQAEAGNVKLVRGAWNDEFLNAMHGQPDLPHDDIPDAAAGAYEDLNDMGWARGAAK